MVQEKPDGKRNDRFSVRGLGPAIIVAAVVCGPGSIVASSKVGAEFGYRAIWVLLAFCLLLAVMVALATRIGITFEKTPCGEIAARLGRPWSAAIGVAMFLIIVCFQASNNIAVEASLEIFGIKSGSIPSVAILCLLNATIIGFLYVGRERYRTIETLMKVLVLVMVVAFALNCMIARPSPGGIVSGLVPSRLEGDFWILAALIGTTFSVAAAFYQAYLVREKGWTISDHKKGIVDSFAGIATLGLITLIVMITAASIFHGNEPKPDLNSAGKIAEQLKPLFGQWSQLVFGVGIIAAVLSSFLVNAMIGGHILSDGLGVGDKLGSQATIHLTAAVLFVALSAALIVQFTQLDLIQLIVFAQALTVIGVPALALALVYLGFVKRKADRGVLPLWMLFGSSVGLVVSILLAVRTIMNLIKHFTQT